MCRSAVKLSKLVRLINIANFTTEIDKRIDKRSKLIEIVSQLCYEKISDDRYRIKTLNDLLKKQKLSSRAFVMYIDIQYDPERDLIILDYPYYPKK
jgi:hypothetical protein